jgi:hypothetical protein
MVLALAQRPQVQSSSRTAVHSISDAHELVAFCPGCKTLETLSFNNGWLMQTRKFYQQGEQVFHDCGTPEPCRLYRTY